MDIKTQDRVLEAKARAAALPETYLDSSPGREQMRVDIANEVYGSGARVKGGEAWIVTGMPASGKNKAVAEPLMREHGAMLIDSDEIKAKIPEFQGGIGAAAVHEESSSIIQPAIIRQAIANRDNIVMPRVGKSYEGLATDLNLLKSNGYRTHLAYVHVPDQIAMKRAVDRFLRTGRLVSLSYIQSVDSHPKNTFERAKKDGLADSYSFYDNSGALGHVRKVY